MPKPALMKHRPGTGLGDMLPTVATKKLGCSEAGALSPAGGPQRTRVGRAWTPDPQAPESLGVWC